MVDEIHTGMGYVFVVFYAAGIRVLPWVAGALEHLRHGGAGGLLRRCVASVFRGLPRYADSQDGLQAQEHCFAICENQLRSGTS